MQGAEAAHHDELGTYLGHVSRLLTCPAGQERTLGCRYDDMPE